MSKSLLRPNTGVQTNYLLSNGQSLEQGSNQSGEASLTTWQRYRNFMVGDSGVIVRQYEPNERNSTNSRETVMAACSRLLCDLLANYLGNRPQENPFYCISSGIPGAEMSEIEKEGTGDAFATGISKANIVFSALTNSVWRIAAVILIHGEADNNAPNTSYDTDITGLFDDYQSDLSVQPDYMYLCQMNSFNGYSKAPVAPQLQWAAHEADSRIRLVTPKYFLPFYDHAHPYAVGYQQLGEYYAKAIYETEILGTPWQPLHMASASLTGSTITINYDIPSGDLVLDTSLATSTDGGFEVFDATDAKLTLSSVTVNGSNQVEIVVASGTPSYVQYGLNTQYNAGLGTARHAVLGNLRDSDVRYTSNYGYDLFNWAISQEINIT